MTSGQPPKNKKSSKGLTIAVVAVAFLVIAAMLNTDKGSNDIAVSDSTLSAGITEAGTQATANGDSTQATAAANSGKTAAANKATNAAANKTAAKQNTVATTVRFPNLPSEFQNHVYMDSRAYGGCDTLTGDVKVTVVFVNDGTSSWNDTAISEEKADHTAAASVLTAAAKSYGKTVNISFVYKTASVSGSAGSVNSDTSWAESVFKAAGLPAISSLNNSLESQYGVKEAPVVLCLNRTGRSFAKGSTASGEHIVLYADGNALAHELLHLFGAEDYYFPTVTESAAKAVFGESIMLNSSKSTVDSLTAYLVGWTDTLDTNAKTFLQKTGNLTAAALAEERKKETYTGYVTNWQLGESIFTGNLKDGFIADGKVFIKYADGATFDGYYKNRQRSGQGTMIYADGEKYVGNWENGQRNGQGTYTYANGRVYTGNFKDGKLNGQGTMTWANGDTYVGAWVDGKRTGQGTYTFANGTVYTGNFKDSEFSGQGTMTWTNGEKYVGSYANGKRNGQGTYTYANGNKYVGAWVAGERTGQGTYTYADGTVYTGNFKDSEFSGQGTMTWTNGNKYVGAWVDGKRTGQGTYTFANGTVYTGNFKDGEFSGQGTMTWTNGDKYVGNYANGKRNGQGTYTWANGNKYVGEWVAGQRTGQGTFTYADGTVKSGTFENGNFIG